MDTLPVYYEVGNIVRTMYSNHVVATEDDTLVHVPKVVIMIIFIIILFMIVQWL